MPSISQRNRELCGVLVMAMFAAAADVRAAEPARVRVSVVHEFHHDPNGDEGAYPGGVAVAPDGSLYGTTEAGGRYGAGTVFRFKPPTQFETIHTFKGPDGFAPDRCLLLGADGAFYGTTGFDTSGDRKDIFRLSPSGDLRRLVTFTLPATREDWRSFLVRGVDGHVYGVSNVDTDAFRLAQHKAWASPGPVYQVVAGVVTQRLIPISNPRDFKVTDSKEDALTRRTSEAPPVDSTVLCGETVPAHDGHLWAPLINGFRVGRSNTTELKGGMYDPQGMWNAAVGRKPTDAERRYAGGAFGRFAEIDDGTILATTRVQEGGNWLSEVVGISIDGAVTRHISLDALGPGHKPVLGLVPSRDGYLYGLAQGESKSSSVMFRLKPAGPVEVVCTFDTEDFERPIRSPIVPDVRGDALYVTFRDGGANHQGAIYRVSVSE
jgi:uncharacterized repeat protein (TIGR03803 family)